MLSWLLVLALSVPAPIQPPSVSPREYTGGEMVRAELFWYDPQLGGINCDHECDYLGTGHKVSEWYGRALACPLEFERGTVFRISGSRWGLADGDWVCLDWGHAIVVQPDGTVTLDLLSRYPIWKETLDVEVIAPNPPNPRLRGQAQMAFRGRVNTNKH